MKGVSDKDAQYNKKIMGDKKNVKKPLQVLHISKKNTNSEHEGVVDDNQSTSKEIKSDIKSVKPQIIEAPIKEEKESNTNNIMDENISYEELAKPLNLQDEDQDFIIERKVDEFDFDESAFLEALNENEPIGATGETIKGKVIALESDGLYIDIGGKAPGFMPKNECGLGVITNLKERFPKGLQVEVLVTREQNADGMVTISCRALELRKSWDKVQNLAKEGKVIRVKINGFNRGGVTCDFEGLRGFIPRSQLEDGENHQSLVSKTINTAFLEVNSERRKLVLSEKKAVIASRFSELEIGQLIEGEILTIKPYGFFVDLKGVSGLLHHSMVTNGSMRSLREVFQPGESIKALITDLDPSRGRIGLNTALLEGPPGELITDKTKVMEEANERAIKARNSLNKEKVDPQKEKEEINLSS